MSDLLFFLYAMSGFVTVLAVPVCFILLSRTIILLLMGRRRDQLRKSMRMVGLFCLPAFVAGLCDIALRIELVASGESDYIFDARDKEAAIFWIPLYGAMFSFVFYLIDRISRMKGRIFGGWYYTVWFLLVLLACYAMVIAWFFFA